jgi:hypothetical protein
MSHNFFQASNKKGKGKGRERKGRKGKSRLLKGKR